jgi:aminopeptidase N
MKKVLYLVIILFSIASCKSTQTVPTVTIEERDLDTLVISAPKEVSPEELAEELQTPDPVPQTLPEYNETYERKNDLLHTSLDLRFDWANEKVIGKATLDIKPHFYPTSSLTLDAKDFEVQKVLLINSSNKKELNFDYDGALLKIQLDKEYKRTDQYSIYIEYVASPAATGGSEAITSNQGLFFINPRNEVPDKPQQIWTQGETEWNSRWFPTIDKPNERCTQEVFVTVEDRFLTLSNGLMVNSTNNTDGTRTDQWKMDQPHAPYLFMLAIGEFARVEDQWNDIIVDYYVEPEYKEDARAIFAHTVEMLDFFSDKLGVAYPWPKYSQVVVRDYVSGAMENTSAVIFGDFVQRKKRELIDNNNDKIVAHEMFHHWFGDLVTCESWANLTMNEGFANYSEYLWLEHKYGADEADYHMLNEWSDYIGSSRSNVHPLIHFGYNDKEDMFDRHSYNKGGSVLHMLRNHIGDDAFWAGLNLYLEDNKYTAVEAHDLRLAFEEVTGQDLNWFFNQWYFDQGHPSFFITHSYENGVASLTVSQEQDAENMRPIFELPVAIDIYLGPDNVIRKNVVLNQRKQTFEFELSSEPKLINFDADRVILAERQDDKTEEELVFQFMHAPKFLDRYEALLKLQNSNSDAAKDVKKQALNDPFWFIRGTALQSLDFENPDLETIRQLAANDPHSEVRSLSYEILLELQDNKSADICEKTIQTDSSYAVIGMALDLLNIIDSNKALTAAKQLEAENSSELNGAIANIYANSGDAKYLPFFEKNKEKIDGYQAFNFFSAFALLATNSDEKTTFNVIDQMEAISLNMGQSPWRRLAAARGVNDIRNYYHQKEAKDGKERAAFDQIVTDLGERLEKMKAAETNPDLKGLYDQLQLGDRP